METSSISLKNQTELTSTTSSSKNAYSRFFCNPSLLATNFFYILPVQRPKTTTSSSKYASVPTVSGDNPVNSWDPSGRIPCYNLSAINSQLASYSSNSLLFEPKAIPIGTVLQLAEPYGRTCVGGNGKVYRKVGAFNNCVWVSDTVVKIWNDKNSFGLSNGEAVSVGLAYICGAIWHIMDASSCDDTLLYGQASVVGNLGSPRDNSINWLLSKNNLSNDPAYLSCFVGNFGPDLLNLPSIASSFESESSTIVSMLIKRMKEIKKGVTAIGCL